MGGGVFARNQGIAIKWAEPKVRKEDYVRPALRRMERAEKFSTFLRNEICSNNLSDFRPKKGLDHLAAVREKFLAITDRFATFQAQCLNVHVEFPLLQRLALPITVGTRSFPASRSTTRA